MTPGTMLFYLLVLYLGAGLITAIIFSIYGASKLAHGAPVSCGARILLIPAATLLWPLILKRWLSGGAG